jgi:peptide/nickel transport system permease protein
MAIDAARARPARENEKLRMLRTLEKRARSERRWGTATLWVGIAIVGLMALAALLAPVIFPGGPNNQDLLNTLQPPSWEHPFGTDNLGRDIFARTFYAARIDLMVGLITTYVPLVLGVLLGLVAGYRGGWLETVVMRAVDVVVAFPFIVLVLAVVAIVGPGLRGVYIGITVVGWALYARLTRAEVLVLKDHQFVLAATSLGYSRRRVMFRHILPNVIRPNLVFSTLDIVLNILVLASLSFLGLGVQPPAAEWGLMVAEGQTFLLTAWWISTLPGVVIVIAGVGFSLVGDGLADRLGRGRRGRVGENEGMILSVAEEGV